MTGPELCPKCKWLHYRTSPCFVRGTPRIPFTDNGKRLSLNDETGEIDIAPVKRGRGRPKTITDMASYKRAKQREYRAKWKGRE